MNIVIIYDSFFNNTKTIAEAMADVSDPLSLKLLDVSEADVKELDAADIIIIGSPTRAFRPSSAISKFLSAIPHSALKNKKVAAFDTRINIKDAKKRFLDFLVSIFGYAAEKIHKKLIEKGGIPAADPEGFFVAGKEGPIKDGEAQRASQWINSIINSK